MQNNYYNGSYYQPPFANQQLEQMAYYENKRKQEKRQLIRTGLLLGGSILAYLIIQTVITLVVLKDDMKTLYDTSAVFANCYGMIVVHLCSVALPFGLMALILRKQFITPVVPMQKVKKPSLFAWIGLGMGICIGANVVVSLIITLCEKLGYELTQGETPEPDSIFSCVTLFIAVSIVPAICEEFAMRCCSLGVLRKYGTGFAVFTVSVVFGLLHGNVIQFVFAFLIGLILGYVTVRTESIVPAILIHALNNAISAIGDIADYILSKDASTYITLIAYVLWISLSIAGLVYLIAKKELLPPKKVKAPKEPYALSLGTKFACLIPGFILPFLMLILLTITTIHKI